MPIAKTWLAALRVDTVAVACKETRVGDGCASAYSVSCHVRVPNGEIATIWCSKGGCTPAEANDQAILSRAELPRPENGR